MARAVALLSGGLDSGVALASWLADGNGVAVCCFADYGQRALEQERRASAALARRFSLAWREVPLPWLHDAARASGSALVPGGADLPQRTAASPGDAFSAQAVWIPARNVVLIAAAAALAEASGAGVVLAGFNREEAATFADNSGAFADAMTAALRFGTRTGVRVESPTLALDKVGIVARARKLGLRAEDFWSCYGSRAEACGTCESCVRSRRAWAAHG